MNDYDLFSGDDVHLTNDPSVKGRIHHTDDAYAFLHIGNELVPFKMEDLTLDKCRPLGIGLFMLSFAVFAGLVLLVFGW